MNPKNILKSQYHHLIKALSNNPYDFYRNHYVPDNDNILDMHISLRDIILSYNPVSVFDFGYGTGKNLKLLHEYNKSISLNGMDISPECQEIAQRLLPTAKLWCGSEALLKEIPDKSYDVSFTCSVLNHIPDIGNTMIELERITKNVIILCESMHQAKFFYPHNYTIHGYTCKDSYVTAVTLYDIYTKSLHV